MVFYYTYWEFEQKFSNPQHRWHDCNRLNPDILLLSVTLLNKVYPNSEIKIIVYNQIPDFFSIFEIFPNVKIINIRPYVDEMQDKNKLLDIKHHNCKNSPFLISKPIDVFNIAKNNKEDFILLDVDFYVFAPFQNIDFSKVGFRYYNESCDNVNTGLIASGTSSFECKYFFDLYEKFLELYDHQNQLVKDKITYNIYKTYETLQEEIIISNITQKFKELKDIIFYDITPENHQLFWSTIKQDYKNNIHAYKLTKRRICSILTKVDYVRHVLSSTHLKPVRDRLSEHMNDYNLSSEEKMLVDNINETNQFKRRILI